MQRYLPGSFLSDGAKNDGHQPARIGTPKTLISNTIRASLLCMATLTSSAAFAYDTGSTNALNATIGTTGLGLEYSMPLSSKLRLRAVGSILSYETEETEDDIDYDFEFESFNGGALLDWHPFSGGFRMSAGLVSTSFGLDLTSTPSQSEFEIGDDDSSTTYTSDNLQLVGEVEFRPVAPYIGIGWASKLDKSGFYFSTELGVMLIGEPKLSFDASGQVSIGGGPAIDVDAFPQFQEDLERERQQVEEELEDFSMWPVLNIGLGYRF